MGNITDTGVHLLGEIEFLASRNETRNIAERLREAIEKDKIGVNRFDTWGYHPIEEAKIFLLKEGESLPDGWYDCPTKAKEASESVKKPVRSASTKAPEEQAESVTKPQAGV